MKTSRKNEIGTGIMCLILGAVTSAIGFIASKKELSPELASAGLFCELASFMFIFLSVWLLLGLSGKN